MIWLNDKFYKIFKYVYQFLTNTSKVYISNFTQKCKINFLCQIHYINRIKNKIHTIISKDAEKHLTNSNTTHGRNSQLTTNTNQLIL